MGDGEFDVVTGGLSYLGKYITRRLVSLGKEVLILTGHPGRDNPFGDQVKLAPFDFEDVQKLASRLQGARSWYNTYWVRFAYGHVSFDQAVEQTKRLIKAAGESGVRKIVHISVSNPSEDSPFPYLRGEAVLERVISQSRVRYAIIRPTLVFGGEEEILINNIAWLLRRFPVFAVPKPGSYRLQPIFVEDVAELAVNAGQSTGHMNFDAAGPDIPTFEDMVRLLAAKLGSRSLILRVKPEAALFLIKLLNRMVSDVVLRWDELGALKADLLVSKHPPVGRVRLSDWLDSNAPALGRRYASELNPHYR